MSFFQAQNSQNRWHLASPRTPFKELNYSTSRPFRFREKAPERKRGKGKYSKRERWGVRRKLAPVAQGYYSLGTVLNDFISAPWWEWYSWYCINVVSSGRRGLVAYDYRLHACQWNRDLISVTLCRLVEIAKDSWRNPERSEPVWEKTACLWDATLVARRRELSHSK